LDNFDILYNMAPNETKAIVSLAFTSNKTDEETGMNFVFSSTYAVHAGVGNMNIENIANAVGGECTLEGTSAGGNFPSGTFSSSNSTDTLDNVEVGVLSTTSTVTITSLSPAVRQAARVDAARRLGPAAYPSQELFRAVTAAPDVSQQVFSNFYDVFLPAGVSHTLKKDALITLKYDASVADPTKLNVYYFDPNNNVFLLENSQRVLDTTNHTLTVAVRHLSTFVVISGNAPVVGTNTYGGRELMAFNFPNPFNLKSKTLDLNNAAPSTTVTTEGTVIKYALPPGRSGTVTIEIFDAAGALVRTITETASAGGTYYYTEWDGRNGGGKKVASGVYTARITVDGGDEKFFKMAVIK
jgi:hypothetical protein